MIGVSSGRGRYSTDNDRYYLELSYRRKFESKGSCLVSVLLTGRTYSRFLRQRIIVHEKKKGTWILIAKFLVKAIRD